MGSLNAKTSKNESISVSYPVSTYGFHDGFRAGPRARPAHPASLARMPRNGKRRCVRLWYARDEVIHTCRKRPPMRKTGRRGLARTRAAPCARTRVESGDAGRRSADAERGADWDTRDRQFPILEKIVKESNDVSIDHAVYMHAP